MSLPFTPLSTPPVGPGKLNKVRERKPWSLPVGVWIVVGVFAIGVAGNGCTKADTATKGTAPATEQNAAAVPVVSACPASDPPAISPTAPETAAPTTDPPSTDPPSTEPCRPRTHRSPIGTCVPDPAISIAWTDERPASSYTGLPDGVDVEVFIRAQGFEPTSDAIAELVLDGPNGLIPTAGLGAPGGWTWVTVTGHFVLWFFPDFPVGGFEVTVNLVDGRTATAGFNLSNN